MSAIVLNPAKCVRSVSKFSECNRCETICPTEAIVVEGMLPAINLASCVGCGGCAGVCPSEALILDDFNTTEFFFSFASDEDNLISCRKNVPCISVLSTEHVMGLATLKEGVVFDMGHCDSCDIATTCRPQIISVAEEANYLLGAIESDFDVKLESLAYESTEEKNDDRRDFFRSFNLKSMAKSKAAFDREVEVATDELVQHTLDTTQIAQMKAKELPDKRKLFFTALKRAQKPSTFHVVDANEVSFTSQKLLDETLCTACQMCYRICPTAALSSDARNGKIDFDPFMCIKCHLCHDVCEPDALTLSSSYNVKEFFEPAVQNLITFDVRRCDECNNLFTSIQGKRICHICQIEDEDARDLWGIDGEF
ncbi:MAG TPA: 4Fe-4S ferredoxin [Helicobacteraceae bacterium]|nr:4Fe-4S ferredoxin [Helicobacteraceae bacterium]